MAHSNNKNMATASPLTEILASFTACTAARGRHISCIFYLHNERETSSQHNLDRCNRRRSSRWMRWRALKIYLITSEEGLTKVQFRKSTNDRAKPWRLFGPNSKWEGATRGARLAGAVLFDPAPGGALVRAYTGNTKSKRP
jgi:hypothetical protein